MSLQYFLFKNAILLFLIFGMSSFAAAAEKEPATTHFLVGIQVGGILHSPFGELGNGTQVRMEGGATFFGQLDAGIVFSWDSVQNKVTTTDERLANGSAEWDITTTFIKVGIPIRWQFLPQGPWDVSAGAGPQLIWSKTTAQGTSGDALLPQNTQEELRVGALLSVMAGRKLGLGFVSLEISLEIGSAQGSMTGNTSTSGIGMLLGYRMRF